VREQCVNVVGVCFQQPPQGVSDPNDAGRRHAAGERNLLLGQSGSGYR
jgi:hypothetical protein